MSINYNAIIGKRAKVTLPSVESWSTDMNILRDPPKAIFTKRREKVSDTSQITTEIDESGNRACENILVFARGVNPSVSVSYDNFGNNGGQNSAFTPGGQRQAKLPYTIIKDGAFRPPVIMPEEAYALSRQPRPWTSSFASKGFADFSRKLRDCGTDQNTRQVKPSTLHAFIRPNPTAIVETPINEPYETRYAIQPSITNDVSSRAQGYEVSDYITTDPSTSILETPLHADARTNPSENRYVNESEFDTTKYIQSSLIHEANTNPSTNCTQIDALFDLGHIPVKSEMLHTSRTTPLSGYERSDYIHEEIELPRRILETSANTNQSDARVYQRVAHENTRVMNRNLPPVGFTAQPTPRPTSAPEHGSRRAYLHPKVSPGGYSVPTQVPAQVYIPNNTSNIESQKARMSRMVYENMHERYTSQPQPAH